MTRMVNNLPERATVIPNKPVTVQAGVAFSQMPLTSNIKSRIEITIKIRPALPTPSSAFRVSEFSATTVAQLT